MNDEQRDRAKAAGDARAKAAKRRPAGPRDADAGDLALPHERDQVPAGASGDTQAPGGPREVIDQAARDVRRGLIDTDRRGAPSDVPGPGPDAEHTRGTVVPPEGVDRERHRPRKPGKYTGG